MEKFQNDVKFPKTNKDNILGVNYLSSNKSPDFPMGVYSLYFDTNKVEIQYEYDEGAPMLVRCFKDSIDEKSDNIEEISERYDTSALSSL
jgi:hypothetical protein